jgi:hypothetical protein
VADPPEPIDHPLEDRKEGPVVSVGEKDAAAVIASRGQVIQGTRKDNAQRASHASTLAIYRRANLTKRSRILRGCAIARPDPLELESE